MRFGIGQPVTRKEDRRRLTGQGWYVADIDLARQTHAVFVLSPHAHARIGTVDKAAAEQLPGVYAVLTGEEWAADGLGTLDPEFMAEDMGGPKGFRTKLPPLAQDRVRYVGERVAVVIAARMGSTGARCRGVGVGRLRGAALGGKRRGSVRPSAPLIYEGAANIPIRHHLCASRKRCCWPHLHKSMARWAALYPRRLPPRAAPRNRPTPAPRHRAPVLPSRRSRLRRARRHSAHDPAPAAEAWCGSLSVRPYPQP